MKTDFARDLAASLSTGLINSAHESRDELRPKLLYNDYRKGSAVITNLIEELNYCNEFFFSIAFITKSGLLLLKDTLKALEDKCVVGRILTTNYLNFSEPKALRELQEFSNLEVRIYTNSSFHTKGYLFHQEDYKTLIIGSSNLTQNALKANKEWNLKVNSLEDGELIKSVNKEFNDMWEESTSLSAEWLALYEEEYNINKESRKKGKITRIKTYTLEPNKMQKAAVQSLKRLRKENKNKALLISATGTGKTYLSAFDVRNANPTRMLFLVHREQILRQAVESFKDVLGEGISAGILSGTSKETEVNYLFSTVNMMSKEDIHSQFDPKNFDYIIIDETHRAGADSYRRILDYFRPQFLLGMTATPERTDGFDIYSLFDHNIAYEIRLQQAMEYDMLCPFHYFGITELNVEGNEIDDTTEFRYLISEKRVNHIIEKASFYGHSGNRVRGLVFCSRKEEARELSRLFNLRGYNTVALCGENSEKDREEAIERLERDDRIGGLDYIFTVDIFNEGVDIPEINQIIMLRPTQSSIVFVQQLGRGLRKTEDKEYVVVLDFIGNYQKNFLIPIAFSGDRTYNKDNLRKYVAGGNRILPGCSTISFDEIAKKRIYASIVFKLSWNVLLLT